MQVYGEMDVYRRAVVVHKGDAMKLACSTPFRSVPAAPPSPPSPSLPPSPSPPGSVEYVITFPDRGPDYPKGTITLSQDGP